MKQAVISFNSSLYRKSTSLFTIVEKVKAKGKCEYLKTLKDKQPGTVQKMDIATLTSSIRFRSLEF